MTEAIAAANHAKFLSHLKASEQTRWQIAQWLSSRGHIVSIPPTKFAETRSDWEQNADDGDLHIIQRIEVKRLSRDFTCRADWPFGDRFIVCAKHAFDRAVPKPFAFVIVASSGSHAAIVLAGESKTWRVDHIKDSRYENFAQEFYLAPMDQVTFIPLGGAI